MAFIVKILYVILMLLVGGYAYHWFGTFKRLSEYSCDDFNEDMEEERHLSERQVHFARNLSYAVFMLGSFFCWALIATTMGKIASEITPHYILKWMIYIVIYIGFVRIPLVTTSKALFYMYEIKSMPERGVLGIVALVFYLWAIFGYDCIPGIFRWHLYFLN